MCGLAYSVLPNSIFPSHDTIAAIIENCFKNEERENATYLTIDYFEMLWTIYAWHLGEESETLNEFIVSTWKFVVCM